MTDVNTLSTALIRELLASKPEFAALSGLGELVSEADFERNFADYSDEMTRHRHDLLAARAAEFASIERTGLDEQERITAELLAFSLRHENTGPVVGAAGHEFADQTYPISHLEGPQVELPMYFSRFPPIEDKRDADRYLKQLRAFTPAFAQVSSAMRRRADIGVRLPGSSRKRLLDDLRAFTAPAPQANLLCTGFEERLRSAPFGARIGKDLLRRAHEAVADQVYPAYRGLAESLRELPVAPAEEIGLCHRPGGGDYYGFLLRANTTLDWPVEAIRSLAGEELRSLDDEIRGHFGRLGLAGESIPELYESLTTPDHHYPASPEGRARLLADARELLQAVKAGLPELFTRLPRADCFIESVPAELEPSMSSHYASSSLDGTRPGVYYLNLAHQLESPSWALPSLTYHESLPGHHLQLALAQELAGLPLIRRVAAYPAYVEGWAKYAETLPWRHGLTEDIEGELGRLKRELGSTANLMIDTGIHSLGWTREEGIDFHRKHTGSSRENAAWMLDRIAVRPGQACAYKIGLVAMERLRAQSQRASGRRFDIRQFHGSLLDNGALPLAVLERMLSGFGPDPVADTGAPV